MVLKSILATTVAGTVNDFNDLPCHKITVCVEWNY